MPGLLAVSARLESCSFPKNASDGKKKVSRLAKFINEYFKA